MGSNNLVDKDYKSMAYLPRIKYKKRSSDFYKDYLSAVSAYFSEKQLSKKYNWEMVVRSVVLFSIWIGLFLFIISDLTVGPVLFPLQVAFHFVMFLLTVCVAHDGSHDAYFKNNRLNKVTSWFFDMVGISSFLWEFNHIKSHHNAPNVPYYDSAIDSFGLFRFHPRAPYRSYHRYQHLYIWGIYAFATLFKLFFLDIFSFGRKRIGFVTIEKHPLKEVLFFAVVRLTVITYTLVIPLLLNAHSWPYVLAGFLVGHFVSGISLGVFFQTTHLHDGTQWPEPDEHGALNLSFDEIVMKTTADFCPKSWWITFLSGGLNLHVAHHLCPDICQIHLPKMTDILEETAKQHGVRYKVFPTVGSAIRSHVKTLKELGRPGSVPEQPAAYLEHAVALT